MSANEHAPVIIKKIKKGGGDGHHGGAWKVAYADFVTAMMAFFLLMWLLNATTEVQRKGIADFFNPTIPINRISGGGEGAFGGMDISSEQTLARVGNGATQRNPAEKNMARGDSGVSDSDEENAAAREAEEAVLQSIEELLTGRAGESMVSEDLARHIITKVTDEGLIVELFALPGSPLFHVDGVEATPILRDLVDIVVVAFGLVKNQVAVNGYAAARPVVAAENPVWTLSSGRSDTVRLMLIERGLDPFRTQRISGFADRMQVVRNPMAVRNNRIEIILLRDSR